MQKYNKAKSMQINLEKRTDAALNAIGNIGAFVTTRNTPFEEAWITEICAALRNKVDELEAHLKAEQARKLPFTLSSQKEGVQEC